MLVAPPIGTMAMPSCWRFRPRLRAIVSTAKQSLKPSTRTTAFGAPVSASDWRSASMRRDFSSKERCGVCLVFSIDVRERGVAIDMNATTTP